MALIFAVSIILAAINNGNLDMNQVFEYSYG